MEIEGLLFRRAVVLGSALVYWIGVWVQARRVRKRIGRSPNVKPRSSKERLLWAGWFLVVVAWLSLPFLAGRGPALLGTEFLRPLVHPVALAVGVLLVAVGYTGTLWCYVVMGDTWRMGVNRGERTTLVVRGPYQTVRHPIYLFQVFMLAGVVFLLPTLLSLLIFFIQFICVLTKAADEESYLLSVHGPEYRDYLTRTGRFLPKWPGKIRSPESAVGGQGSQGRGKPPSSRTDL